MSKSFAPSTIGPGSTTALQFVITNSTSVGARSLSFSDSLPAAVAVASPVRSSSCGGSITETSTTISFDGGELGPGSSCTITVYVTSSTVGTHTNTTSILTWDGGSSSAASADLTVATNHPGFSKSFFPTAVAFGGRSTLTFSIDNTANGSFASGLSFTDSFPSGLSVASPANASSTCGGTFTATTGATSVSLLFGSVLAGQSCTLTVDVIGGSVGSLDNVSDLLLVSGQANGYAAASLLVTIEQIALIKTFIGDPVNPGDTVDLEFTVQNLNRGDSALDITFTDDLDATLSGLAVSGALPTNPCGSGSSLSFSGGVLTLTGGNLSPEAACTFTVTLTVPTGSASGTYLNETSEISASIGGRPVTGYAATDVLEVAAGISFTKTFIGDPVGAGDSIVLEFTITNGASSAATNIAFMDPFVDELISASSVPSAGFCGGGATAVFFPTDSFNPPRLIVSGASLAAGDSCTFSVTLNVSVSAATNTYENTTGELTATIGGETVSGGTASDTFDVVAGPTLTKEFTDDPAQPGGTVTLTFTLSLDENSPANATGITFSDDLGATLTGLTATGLPVSGCGGSIDGTPLTFSGGSLSPGETCSISVTLDVPSSALPGSYTNTTSTVMADVGGVATLSNPASDDLSIAGLVLTKEFIDDPVLPGGTVTLRFTLENTSPSSDATDIVFTDRLNDVLSGLAATGLTGAAVCGASSSLSGTSTVSFTGGSLVAGDSCTFDVSVSVPAGTTDGIYVNTTSSVRATVEGGTIFFDPAFDTLTVNSDYLSITKEFTDDPVSPGGTVTLEFTITNLHESLAVSNVAFTDDLDAALSGLVATGFSSTCGGTVSGTGTITLSGGTVAAGSSCTITATLQVPSEVELGTVATNTTSEVTGTISGVGVTGAPASDDLQINYLTLSKSFSSDTPAGGYVTLSFTIQNLSTTASVSQLSFTDDLDAMLFGTTAIGLPDFDVCGEGSSISGTSFLTFAEGSLLPGGSCTFNVMLQVPEDAEAGEYENTTSDLAQGGSVAASPASDVLTVTPAPVDSDGDGVLDNMDVCPGTTIPESVPTVRLNPNHWALIDGDFVFDTNTPPGQGPGGYFTTTDTAGCSCEQIIEALGLGKGHEKFGCSIGVMRTWVNLVN